MKAFLLIILYFVSLHSRAQVNSDPSPDDVREALKFARSTGLSVNQRKNAAQFGLDYIRKTVAKDLSIKNIDDLYTEFAKHPELENKLNLKDTKGLGGLVTEFNLLINQIGAEMTLGSCYNYKKNLPVRVMEGMQNYNACNEGTSIGSFSKVTGSTSSSRFMPGFAIRSNINDILNVTNHASYINTDEATSSDPFRPTLEQLKVKLPLVKTDKERASYALMSELRGKSYSRAVLNSLRNKMILDLTYSDKYGDFSGADKEEKWKLFCKDTQELVSKSCKHCTPEMMSVMTTRINTSISNELSRSKFKPRSAKEVTSGLCQRLIKEGYPFDDGPEFKSALQAPRNPLQFVAYLQNKRKKIFEALGQEGGDYFLFKMKAISELENTKVKNTFLKCTPESLDSDVEIIKAGQNEAASASHKLVTKLNDLIQPQNYSAVQLSKEFKELLILAAPAVGEAALTTSTGGFNKFVCDVIISVNEDDAYKQGNEDLTLFATTTLMTVITAATAGAASPLMLGAGAVANSFLGVSMGVEYFNKAETAKDLAELYRQAAIAQGMDPKLIELSEEEFQSFKSAQLAGVMSIGGAFLEATGTMISLAARSGKPLSEVSKDLALLAKKDALEARRDIAELKLRLAHETSVASRGSGTLSEFAAKNGFVKLEAAKANVASLKKDFEVALKYKTHKTFTNGDGVEMSTSETFEIRGIVVDDNPLRYTIRTDQGNLIDIYQDGGEILESYLRPINYVKSINTPTISQLNSTISIIEKEFWALSSAKKMEIMEQLKSVKLSTDPWGGHSFESMEAPFDFLFDVVSKSENMDLQTKALNVLDAWKKSGALGKVNEGTLDVYLNNLYKNPTLPSPVRHEIFKVSRRSKNDFLSEEKLWEASKDYVFDEELLISSKATTNRMAIKSADDYTKLNRYKKMENNFFYSSIFNHSPLPEEVTTLHAGKKIFVEFKSGFQKPIYFEGEIQKVNLKGIFLLDKDGQTVIVPLKKGGHILRAFMKP